MLELKLIQYWVGEIMAKRRRTARARNKVITIYRKVARRAKKSTSLTKPFQIDAMIYGGLRQKVSTMVSQFTTKIPLGSLADEAVMGTLNYFVAKKSSGMIKNIAIKGLIVENARVGEAIATEGLSILNVGGNTSSNTAVNIYG